MNFSYTKYAKGEFSSKIEPTSSESNLQTEIPKPEQSKESSLLSPSSPLSLSSHTLPAKRQHSENPSEYNNQKQRKLDQSSTEAEPSTSGIKSHTPCKDRSGNRKDEENRKNSSSEYTTGISSFVFGCFHCNDSNISNENPKEIYDHWKAIHSNNRSTPFLFRIISEKSERNESPKGHFKSFKSIKLTNFQLNRLLSIEHPSKEVQRAENNENRVKYLMCGECNLQFNQNMYFEHILQMHSDEVRGESDDNRKSRLKTIDSSMKVVFTNGLVLTKYNLLKTDLGCSEQFDKFIDTLVSIKIEGKDDECTTSSATIGTVPRNEKTSATSTSNSDSSNHIFQRRELEKQQQRMNTISILGISQRDGRLNDIFSRICHKLKFRINFETDVTEVFNPTSKIIGVKFHDLRKKDEILSCSRRKLVYTNDIFSSLPRDESQRITIKDYLTPYYGKIENHLKRACQQGKIHWFKLTKDGFAYKKTQYSDSKIILSIREFELSLREEDPIQLD